MTHDNIESIWRQTMRSSADNAPMAFARALVAAERERWRSAVLAMRGRLLWLDQRADTSEVDALLFGPNAQVKPARRAGSA